MPRPRFTGKRLSKHWHVIPTLTNTFTANATVVSVGLNLDGPWTVLRMLGEYIINPTPNPVSGDIARVTVGIGVMSADAVTLGATAMPDPGDSDDAGGYPWLYWAEHGFYFGGTAVDPNSAGSSLRRPFDIKSMRKIKPRESLAMIAQYTNVAGTPSMQFVAGFTRVLVGD